MTMYKLTLDKRRRISERRKERYRTEPQYRLDRINDRRVALGKAELATLDGLRLKVELRA
jgi:hypothetical protein